MWWSRTGMPPVCSAASGLGVERTGEVLQAAVDLEGDHAVAGTESAGDIQRGGEVRAGGRPGEDALVAGAGAGRDERPGLEDDDDLVVVGGMQLRRPLADAAALDVMGTGRTAREHGRFGGPDHGPAGPRQRGGHGAPGA